MLMWSFVVLIFNDSIRSAELLGSSSWMVNSWSTWVCECFYIVYVCQVYSDEVWGLCFTNASNASTNVMFMSSWFEWNVRFVITNVAWLGWGLRFVNASTNVLFMSSQFGWNVRFVTQMLCDLDVVWGLWMPQHMLCAGQVLKSI